LKLFENILGEICKIILPINEEIFLGNPKSSMAICTISSMSLLKEISNSDLMKKIAVVGRLLSENRGIDSLVRYIISKNNIKTIIICGKEVLGHKSGLSLICLFRNGINDDSRIIDSSSPNPHLTVTQTEVEKFRTQVKIINKIGETDLLEIFKTVNSIKS